MQRSSAERTISIRLLWPFVRVGGGDAEEMRLLESEGIGLAEFADPQTRLRHSVSMDLLERSVRRTGDPTLGLRAGLELEPSDLGVLDQCARACPDLRSSILWSSRYLHLVNGASELELYESGDTATVYWRIIDGVPQTPAANDFVVTAQLEATKRNTGTDVPPLEVRLMHERPTCPDAYERIFRAPTRFGAPHNAIVIARSRLDVPLLHADRGLLAAFELRAQALSRRLRRDHQVADQARRVLREQLPNGDPGMESVARRMHMSVATLLRRLEREETSHRQLLDEVRNELARGYLLESELSVSEIAFRLGFAHVPAFHRAFKRWCGGTTPTEFRAAGRTLAGSVIGVERTG